MNEDLPPDSVERSSSVDMSSYDVAMWRAARKYLAIICSAIFAIILAQPSVVRSSKFNFLFLKIPVNDMIVIYLMLGLVGAFFAELLKAFTDRYPGKVKLFDSAHNLFIRLRIMLIIYALFGMLILLTLLDNLLS